MSWRVGSVAVVPGKAVRCASFSGVFRIVAAVARCGLTCVQVPWVACNSTGCAIGVSRPLWRGALRTRMVFMSSQAAVWTPQCSCSRYFISTWTVCCTGGSCGFIFYPFTLSLVFRQWHDSVHIGDDMFMLALDHHLAWDLPIGC